MKEIKWVVIGIIILLNINLAVCNCEHSYSNDGTGIWTGHKNSVSYNNDGDHTLYVTSIYHITYLHGYCRYHRWYYSSNCEDWVLYSSGEGSCPTYTGYKYISKNYALLSGKAHLASGGQSGGSQYDDYYITSIITENPISEYYITGYYDCTDWVKIYHKTSDDNYIWEATNDTGVYNFSILSTVEYKLVFSDGHEYEFICNDSNIEYNYYTCEYMIINIYDDCGNLLIAPHTIVYDRDQSLKLLYDGYDNPINIDMTKTSVDNEIWVSWLTEAGRVDKTIFARSDYPYNLYDQIISWNLNVIVTDNTSNPLSDAKVWIYQNCSPCEGSRFGYTNNNGSIVFNCLEGNSFDLDVWKSGYKHYNGTTDFLATAQCLDYSIHIPLEPSGSENTTKVPENITEDSQTNVWFTDPNGNYVNEVNDTVEYVDLHYQIYRYDDEDMDLKFQHNIDTLWYTVWSEYLIPNGSSGYYRIYRSGNFSNCGLYRGYLSNDDDFSFDQIAGLRVVNESNESTSHLENLTAWCWIWNTEYDGKIDYHEDIECIIYANSTNSSLMSITVKFYEDSTLKDTKTLNWANFVNGDPQFYYRWYPDYEYQINHNYTLKIYGYDNTLLDTDSAYTESIRGLKLTIYVVDGNNNPLDHAYCYVEGWGSLYTDYESYATMKGLNTDSYHYKAEKGGYRSTGWAIVNMADDESVTYTLYEDTTQHAARMSKTDVKALFYPFMFVLLIVMLMGGLIHVFD